MEHRSKRMVTMATASKGGSVLYAVGHFVGQGKTEKTDKRRSGLRDGSLKGIQSGSSANKAGIHKRGYAGSSPTGSSIPQNQNAVLWRRLST